MKDCFSSSGKVWEYVKAKRELFINVGEKVLKLFLSAGY
jgi:hypothetical protein